MDPIKIVGPSWADVIGDEFQKPYMQKISKIVRYHRQKYQVFPPPQKVMRAFQLTPYEKVKVVILGQDPYPTEGHADGLAFSSSEETLDHLVPTPKSLKNIFQEIEDDLGFVLYQNPDLTRWAKQGVLLLNTSLTVVEGQPGSHSQIGWDQFVRTVIAKLNNRREQIVYLLWGRYAQTFAPFIKDPHEYLTAAHPSPLSVHRGFKGCRHFSKCNKMLELSHQQPIDWTKDYDTQTIQQS